MKKSTSESEPISHNFYTRFNKLSVTVTLCSNIEHISLKSDLERQINIYLYIHIYIGILATKSFMCIQSSGCTNMN